MSGGGFAVRVSKSAENDIAAIAAYLAEHGAAEAALRFIETIGDRIETLASFPLRGPIPSEIESLQAKEYRQLLFGRYRIVFKVVEQTVTVVLVADGRRDMQTLLRDRLLVDRSAD